VTSKAKSEKAPLQPAKTLFGMGRRVARVIFDKARDVDDERRFRCTGYYDQGAEMFVMRGGAWGSTPDRIASGFTKADVEDVRRKMRDLGYAATFDHVDGLLRQAQAIRDEQNARKRSALRRAA
jgi:hypothetical protein